MIYNYILLLCHKKTYVNIVLRSVVPQEKPSYLHNISYYFFTKIKDINGTTERGTLISI